MARVPEIIRRNNISQVAPEAPRSAGAAWGALAEIAKLGAETVMPAAQEQARIKGLNSTYRDENGQLKVGALSPAGGPLADAFNSAAQAKYLSQRSIDIGESFTELAVKYQFDPEGFKQASDLYIQSLRGEEGVPPLIREEVAARAEREASNRFNGLYQSQVSRTQSDADKNTKTQRDMVADDYINLVMAGDTEAAAEKYAELEQISQYRSDAAYISETPAETEDFLRGVRGTAKAAALTRELEDLSGASQISDEKRKEIEEVLKDPDLSPRARASLYAATQGRLKGIDARAFADRVASDDYESKVVRKESAGRADAKNSLSSATGHHQFTEGTWAGLVKKYKPDWANGLSPSQIAALRKDPAKSSEMFQHFRRENQAVLRKNGLPINDATEYMMHFFGAGDGPRVMSAPANTLVSDIVSPGKISANPHLKGMTVSDAMNWAARSMTVKGSDLAAMRTKFDAIEDVEVRSLAMRAFEEHYRSRVQMENAASTEYETRLNAKDDTLTEREVLSDHNLSDEAQQAILGEMRKQRGLTDRIQDTMFRLSDPAARFDPYDGTDRGRVDDVFKLELGDEDPLSKTGMATAAKYVARTGFLPKTSVNAVRGALQSDDPAVVSSAMEFMDQVLDREPGAIASQDGRAGIEKSLADYSLLTRYMSGEQAAAKMIEARQNPPSRNLVEQGKKLARGLEVGDVVDHFSGLGMKVEIRSGMQEALVTGDYEELFVREYEATGDEELAKNRALTQLSRIWGPNTVSGGNQLMRYPPQNFYGMSAGDMGRQLAREVSTAVYGDKATELPSVMDQLGDAVSMGLSSSRSWIPADRIFLLPDDTTRAEVTSGKAPTYKVRYMDGDDILQEMPGRFKFEKPQGMTADEFQSARSDQQAKDNVRMWRTYMRENTAKSDAEIIQELEANIEQYKLTPPPEE